MQKTACPKNTAKWKTEKNGKANLDIKCCSYKIYSVSMKEES